MKTETAEKLDMMTKLREGTKKHHERMHANPLMQAILRGTSTRSQYLAQLSQLQAIYLFLEGAYRGENEITRKVITDEQFRWRMLADDLAFLSDGIHVKQLPETEVLISDLERRMETPANVLGAAYVLEGSIAGGGSILAERVRRNLNLVDGTKYLEGHGPRERQAFQEFGERMNSAITAKDVQNGIVRTAQQLFTDLDNLYRAIAQL